MLKLKILIIDDEADYCVILEHYFENKGYDVTVATTLKDGLEKLTSVNPDILLMDNNLPDGKAWDHINEIVTDHPLMKIFLISAYYLKTDTTHFPGNVTVLEKPLSLNMLTEVMEDA
jgi:CheY-like chemotaxis protein